MHLVKQCLRYLALSSSYAFLVQSVLCHLMWQSHFRRSPVPRAQSHFARFARFRGTDACARHLPDRAAAAGVHSFRALHCFWTALAACFWRTSSVRCRLAGWAEVWGCPLSCWKHPDQNQNSDTTSHGPGTTRCRPKMNGEGTSKAKALLFSAMLPYLLAKACPGCCPSRLPQPWFFQGSSCSNGFLTAWPSQEELWLRATEKVCPLSRA